MVSTRLDPRRIQVDLIDYALPSPEICGITEGYILELLKMGGFEASATQESCVREGGDRCRWLIRLERAV